jgi:glutathione S-transferase
MSRGVQPRRQGRAWRPIDRPRAIGYGERMVHLRSTTGCVNTPRILFALEEMGVPYRIEIVPDGSFSTRYGIPGPELVEEDGILVEVSAIVRHVARRYGLGTLWPDDLHGMAEVDRWLDFQAIRLARAAAAREVATLHTLLAALDHHVVDQPWLLARGFTVADVGFLPALSRRERLPLERYPAVDAYLDRLAARPALSRARAATP